ncbi:MAG: pyridoxamine kinase [Ruminococcaceae bacterium]|nr:pyridoxamine kinase [Oscillospiraceae bacterium]
MKRIVTVQDISAVGKCSLTVALPIISACGVECAVMPTAVLSTHTQFSGFTFHDLTDEIAPITEHWKKEGLTFDAIYTGYLGSFRQIELVEKLHETFGSTLIVDPAMADNGKLYYGFTEEFAARMAQLCGKADLILPNLTEACFMLGRPYTETYTQAEIREMLRELCALGAKRAALTGVSYEKGKVGFEMYDSVTDTFSSYFGEHLPVAYHGTGDIFASSCVGAMARGKSIEDALKVAVDYTYECVRLTLADEDRRDYGVNFEEAIPYLIERLK